MTKRTRKPKGELTFTTEVLPSGLKDGETVTIGGNTAFDGEYTFKAAKKPRKKRTPKIQEPVEELAWYGPEPTRPTATELIEEIAAIPEPYTEEEKFERMTEEELLAGLELKGYIPKEDKLPTLADILQAALDRKAEVEAKELADQLAENPFDRPQEAKEKTLQDIVQAMSDELKALSIYPNYYDLTKSRNWKTFNEAYKIILQKYRGKIEAYQLVYGDEAVSITLD